MMNKRKFYLVNAVTVYRLASAFFLLYLVLDGDRLLFRWLLAISFLTDAIDGYLARRWKVVTEIGSRLDSIADDVTILIAIIGMFAFRPAFVREQLFLIVVLTGLYLLQLALALLRYKKPTSFHTYLAKAAAVAQGFFLVLLFFLPQPNEALFYLAALITFLDLAEEVLLVLLLPTWKTDVRGIFWLKRNRQLH